MGSSIEMSRNKFWTGLCYAKLLDFNNDGINELILTYQTERYNKDKVQYHVELWKYGGKSAKRVTSRIHGLETICHILEVWVYVNTTENIC